MGKKNKRKKLETLEYSLSALDRITLSYNDRIELYSDLFSTSITIDNAELIEDNSTIYFIDDDFFDDPSYRFDYQYKIINKTFDSTTFYV